MLTGTPPVLSMIGVQAGVDLLLEAGMDALWEKSQELYAFAHELWKSDLELLGVGLGSPEPQNSHGSHITLTHPHAYAVDQALIQIHQVIPDYRAPDGVRFGFAPLYTSFEDVERSFAALKGVLESKEWSKFEGEIGGVT